jgi:hypothetical protein
MLTEVPDIVPRINITKGEKMDSFAVAELIIILLHVLVKKWERNPKFKKRHAGSGGKD